MHIVGIHLDYPYLRLTRIRKTRKGIQIDWHQTVSIEDSSKISEPLDAPLPKQRLLNHLPHVKQLYIKNLNGKIVSGLSSNDFLVRLINVKMSAHKHLEKALAFQAEAISHFKPEEIIHVPLIQKKDKGKAEALLFTVPKENLKAHLEKLKGLGADPDIVSTIPLALCHFARWRFPELREAFIIDLGSNAVNCALMEDGELKKAHAIASGVESLLEALHQDRKRILLKNEIEGAARQIDLFLLKGHLNPNLYKELNALKQEIGKVYYSFTRGLIKPILFTGRADAFIHLGEWLAEPQKEEHVLSSEEQKAAVSLGLCLEQAQKKALQLRKEEFFPEKNWVLMGKMALILLSCSLAVSMTLAGLGMYSSKKKKEHMLDAIHTDFRNESNSEEDIEKKIDSWIEAVEKNSREYPFISQSPKVAEVLSWLSSHSVFKELQAEGDPIDIRELRVQLVKFPTVRSEKESYLAKVELQFRCKSIMSARRFHEALRLGDEFVNPNLEITWDILNDGYRTTFFLKNRVPYVP